FGHTRLERISRAPPRTSAPQLLAGELGTLGERAELRPDDGGWNARQALALRKATIRSSYDVFATDELCVTHHAFSDQLRMFDDWSAMADHSRNERFAFWEAHIAPELPFVRMTCI